MAGESDSFLLLVIAFLFPPAAVAFIAGCGPDLCLNILLTLIGYLPGCIHAFWLVFRRSEANQRFGQNNWIYTGAGEYGPRSPGPVTRQEQPPAPPPSGTPGRAPPPPGEGKQAPPPPPEEERQGEKGAPPEPPADEKATKVASSQPAADEKMEESAPQYTATPSGA